MQKQKLWYWCACCLKMVCHPIGPHYMDNYTQLFCPECEGITIVEFHPVSREKATRGAIERAGDSIPAEAMNER